MKNSYTFNAFANKIRDYNLISVTNCYVVQTCEIFNKDHCKYIFLAGINGKKSLSKAFAALEENSNFTFSNFMRNCLIEFTFGHEFQHILQLNSDSCSSSYAFGENNCDSEYSIKKHAWEFDADRFGAFEVLKYSFNVYRGLKVDNTELLKCLIYPEVASLVITRLLFYLNIVEKTNIIKIQELYTNKFSHPHPFVRIINIIDFTVNCCQDDFAALSITFQDMLNYTLKISKLFFKSYIPEQNPLESFFEMLDVNVVNHYNHELYEFAINDNAIRSLLLRRNINF